MIKLGQDFREAICNFIDYLDKHLPMYYVYPDKNSWNVELSRSKLASGYKIVNLSNSREVSDFKEWIESKDFYC